VPDEIVSDGIIYLARVGVNIAVFTSPSRAKQWVQKTIRQLFESVAEKDDGGNHVFGKFFPGQLTDMAEQSKTYEGAVQAYEFLATRMIGTGAMVASVTNLTLNSED